MSPKNLAQRQFLWVVLMACLAVSPALAGSAVIGSVSGSINATIDGQAILPNTTIASGDSLHVRDGVAVLAVGNSGSRMVFGRETVVSFLRESSDVTAILSEGSVSLFKTGDDLALRVKAANVVVEPAKGFKSLGEVAMANGALVITTKEGSLQVVSGGSAVDVPKGKVITVSLNPQAQGQKAGKAAGKTAGKAAGHAAGVSTQTALEVTTVATGGISSVLSGVAMSRAGDAKTEADTATTDANSAASAADSATNAANTALATANSAGCAVNSVWTGLGASGLNLGSASPYTPPSGSTCP